jgi:DNA ligase-1
VVLLADLARASRAVAGTRARLEKVSRLSELLRGLAPAEIEIAVSYLVGELRQGKIGLGWSALSVFDGLAAPETPSITLAEADAAFEAVATATGKGRSQARERALGELAARATPEERDFLKRLILGELRQGALEGVLLDALARAGDVPLEKVKRALLFAGSLRAVSAAVLREGAAGLDRFSVELFRPLSPMLAEPGDSVGATLERMPGAALEYKLDGARIQLHKRGDDVRVFSRGGHDVTRAVPEVVELARALPARSLLLDGEAIALGRDFRPLPFQATMRRFGRKAAEASLTRELPLSSFFFDCLYLDDQPLVDAPNHERVRALSSAVPDAQRVPRRLVDGVGAADEFFAQALSAGHEGLVAKDPESVYVAGRRAAQWLKIKPAHTLDLVVLAVEHGSGRRTGTLSNIHLGARDPEGGGFAMLGKTFKGMTDAMLAWQTARFSELALRTEGHVVHLDPIQVVEVAFDGVQASSQYPSGLSLRFARVVRYRADKLASEADTIDTVRALARRGEGES